MLTRHCSILAPAAPFAARPAKPAKSGRRLAIELLETRLNLSGLAAVAPHAVSPAMAALAHTASYTNVKPISISLSSNVKQAPLAPAPAKAPATAPLDTTSLVGDDAISASSVTNIPVTDYYALTNCKIEYQSASPDIGYMTTSGVAIEYHVNAAAAGSYKLTFGVAAQNWASFDLYINGSRTAQYSFNATGGWNTWTTTSQNVNLAAGANTVQIIPTAASQFNINAVQATPLNPTTTATATTTTSTTNSNAINVNPSATITAGQYSNIYNSKLENIYSQADIGYVSTAGAWVEYTLNVQTAGNYNISVNTAAQSAASYNLLVNGSQAATYQTSGTGGWGSFSPLANTVYLPAGTVTLRFASMNGTQYNIGTINVNAASSNATTPTTPTAPQVPAGNTTANAVNINTTWMTSFNQLNVIGSAGNDNIYVSQSGDTLTINADGQASTYSASAYGDLVIKANGGNDTITVDSSVHLDTLLYGGAGSDTLVNKTQGHGTIVSIGGGWDSLTGNGVNTSYWADTSDTINASSAEWAGGHVHQVSSFWGGVSTDLSGQNLADPAGTGSTTRLSNASLWGTGPTMSDVNQGEVSDCFLLGSMQSLAYASPDKLREVAVDLGDGTYAVQFQRGGTNTFVRVDGDLPAGGWYANGLMYAHPGPSGTIWMPIIEKAYAEFRTGAWNYSSLNDGNFNVSLADFGFSSTSLGSVASSNFTAIQNAINNHKAVTIGTNAGINSGAPLIGSHTYTVTAAWTDSAGNQYVTLRNPWGYDGAGSDSNPNDGLVSMTMAQLQANMLMGSYLA